MANQKTPLQNIQDAFNTFSGVLTAQRLALKIGEPDVHLFGLQKGYEHLGARESTASKFFKAAYNVFVCFEYSLIYGTSGVGAAGLAYWHQQSLEKHLLTNLELLQKTFGTISSVVEQQSSMDGTNWVLTDSQSMFDVAKGLETLLTSIIDNWDLWGVSLPSFLQPYFTDSGKAGFEFMRLYLQTLFLELEVNQLKMGDAQLQTLQQKTFSYADSFRAIIARNPDETYVTPTQREAFISKLSGVQGRLTQLSPQPPTTILVTPEALASAKASVEQLEQEYADIASRASQVEPELKKVSQSLSGQAEEQAMILLDQERFKKVIADLQQNRLLQSNASCSDREFIKTKLGYTEDELNQYLKLQNSDGAQTIVGWVSSYAVSLYYGPNAEKLQFTTEKNRLIVKIQTLFKDNQTKLETFETLQEEQIRLQEEQIRLQEEQVNIDGINAKLQAAKVSYQELQKAAVPATSRQPITIILHPDPVGTITTTTTTETRVIPEKTKPKGFFSAMIAEFFSWMASLVSEWFSSKEEPVVSHAEDVPSKSNSDVKQPAVVEKKPEGVLEFLFSGFFSSLFSSSKKGEPVVQQVAVQQQP